MSRSKIFQWQKHFSLVIGFMSPFRRFTNERACQLNKMGVFRMGIKKKFYFDFSPVFLLKISLLFFCISIGKGGETLVEDIHRLRNSTVDDLWNVTCEYNLFNEESWRNHVSTKIMNYQRHFVETVRSGYDPNYENSWSFSGAFLYSLTVITTIGKKK